MFHEFPAVSDHYADKLCGRPPARDQKMVQTLWIDRISETVILGTQACVGAGRVQTPAQRVGMPGTSPGMPSILAQMRVVGLRRSTSVLARHTHTT